MVRHMRSEKLAVFGIDTSVFLTFDWPDFLPEMAFDGKNIILCYQLVSVTIIICSLCPFDMFFNLLFTLTHWLHSKA